MQPVSFLTGWELILCVMHCCYVNAGFVVRCLLWCGMLVVTKSYTALWTVVYIEFMYFPVITIIETLGHAEDDTCTSVGQYQ